MDTIQVGKKILDPTLIQTLIGYFRGASFQDVQNEIQTMKDMKINNALIYYFIPTAVLMAGVSPVQLLPKIKNIITYVFGDNDETHILFQQTAILCTRSTTRLRKLGILL